MCSINVYKISKGTSLCTLFKIALQVCDWLYMPHQKQRFVCKDVEQILGPL